MYCMIYSILLLYIDTGPHVGPIICKSQVPLSRQNPSSKSLNSRNHSQHFFKVISFSGEAVCPVQPNFRLRSKTTFQQHPAPHIKSQLSHQSFRSGFSNMDFLPFLQQDFVSIAINHVHLVLKLELMLAPNQPWLLKM